MDLQVETDKSMPEEQRPLAFWHGGVRKEILDIEDRWYSPEFSYFKIFAADAGTYIIKKNRISGVWSLVHSA